MYVCSYIIGPLTIIITPHCIVLYVVIVLYI